MSAKQIGMAFGLAFAVALAVVVGKQMSTEAMAVVIGVVCGVAAGIPTSVLLLLALSRRDRQRLEEAEHRAQQGSYPPVVVIQGGVPQPLPTVPPTSYWPAPQPGPLAQRRFHVIGGNDLLLSDGSLARPSGWGDDRDF